MAVRSRVVAVTDAAPVVVYRATGAAELKSDAVFWVDDAADTVFIGGPTVTNAGANRGVPIVQARPLSVSGISGDVFYAICGAGQSCDVVVLSNLE